MAEELRAEDAVSAEGLRKAGVRAVALVAGRLAHTAMGCPSDITVNRSGWPSAAIGRSEA